MVAGKKRLASNTVRQTNISEVTLIFVRQELNPLQRHAFTTSFMYQVIKRIGQPSVGE